MYQSDPGRRGSRCSHQSLLFWGDGFLPVDGLIFDAHFHHFLSGFDDDVFVFRIGEVDGEVVLHFQAWKREVARKLRSQQGSDLMQVVSEGIAEAVSSSSLCGFVTDR